MTASVCAKSTSPALLLLELEVVVADLAVVGTLLA
jgi:hypothetical protein